MYLDANNLYGWAMPQYLPTGRFRWASQEEITQLTADSIAQIADDSNTGYILEVDLGMDLIINFDKVFFFVCFFLGFCLKRFYLSIIILIYFLFIYFRRIS